MSTDQSSSSWWNSKAVLIISLAFNIFFIGTVVGGGVIGNRLHERSEQIRKAPPVHSFASPRKMLRYMTEDERQQMISVLKEDMKVMRPALKKVRQLRNEALDTLRAEPFDQAAAAAAFSKLAIAEAEVQEASNQATIKMLKSLPDERRQAVLQAMKEDRDERRTYKKFRREQERQREQKSKVPSSPAEEPKPED